MAALLSLETVAKRYRCRGRDWATVEDVSLDIEGGELIGIYDPIRSAATSLLRVAAGIEAPDSGRVLFNGRDLALDATPVESGVLRYADGHFESGLGCTVLEQVEVPLLARRSMSLHEARGRAEDVLSQVGAQACGRIEPEELGAEELARVRIARALAVTPRVLVIDGPASDINATGRDNILALLRGLADDGIAVLMTVPGGDELAGVDRALQIDGGRLLGQATPETAHVVPLRRASNGLGSQ